MSELIDGSIILTAEEFINFLKGKSRDDNNLKDFYSDVDNMFPRINAEKLRVQEFINFEEEFEFDIRISDSIFEKKINFNDGVYKNLWFTKCVFKEGVRVYGGNFKWFWFTECLLNENLTISNGYFKSVSFSNNSIKGNFLIEGGVFNEVGLKQTDNSKNTSIKGPFTLINYLSIDGGIAKSSLMLNNCTINIIKYKGVYNSGSIIVNEDLRVFCLLFEEVVNLGYFLFSNIEVVESIFKIQDQPIDTLFLSNSELVFNDDNYETDTIKRSITRNNTKYLLQYVNHHGNRSYSFNKRNINKLKDLLFYKGDGFYENIHIKMDTSTFEILKSSLGKSEFKNLSIDDFNL
ncbi:MAG: hypothetical protein ACI9Y7_002372 [Dokdonia sp.]|jgi:hypothetical protein